MRYLENWAVKKYLIPASQYIFCNKGRMRLYLKIYINKNDNKWGSCTCHAVRHSSKYASLRHWVNLLQLLDCGKQALKWTVIHLMKR